MLLTPFKLLKQMKGHVAIFEITQKYFMLKYSIV